MTATTAPPPALAPASKEERRAMLSVRQLMWLRFRRNHLAVAGGVILIIMYTMAIFAEFFAPYAVDRTHDKYVGAPPAGPRFFDEAGNWQWPPVVYGLKGETDLATFRKVFTPNPDEKYPIRFFGQGDPYKLLGLFPSDRHLFTVDEPAVLFLMGTQSAFFGPSKYGILPEMLRPSDLPRANGIALYRELQKQFPSARHLFMSGYPSHGDDPDAMDAAHFLAKPFTRMQLAQKVRAVLLQDR